MENERDPLTGVVATLKKILRGVVVSFWLRVISAVASFAALVPMLVLTIQRASEDSSHAPLIWIAFLLNVGQEAVYSLSMLGMLWQIKFELDQLISLNEDENTVHKSVDRPVNIFVLVSFSDVAFDFLMIINAWLWLAASAKGYPIAAIVSFSFALVATVCDVIILGIIVFVRLWYRYAFTTQKTAQELAAEEAAAAAAGAAGDNDLEVAYQNNNNNV